MPASTRSASASLASPVKRAIVSSSSSPAKRQRIPSMRDGTDSSRPSKQSKTSSTPSADTKAAANGTTLKTSPSMSPLKKKFDIVNGHDDSEELVGRAELSFNLHQAKQHLTLADPRFRSLFDRLPCKPFEEETDLNPFKALCCSILGQQISWLAARSITHKFIRLVAYPDLPEKPAPTGMTTLFPTPKQVANTDITTLRAAGLSQRKAEYVQDLATRFSDGRLSAKQLVAMSDDEVMQALCEVRGIGKWTVEMFMIFTLRRPNVLPCGDLGIQKGLVRWFTQVNPSIHVRKLPNPQASADTSSNVEPVQSSSTTQTPSTPTSNRNQAPGNTVVRDIATPAEPPSTPSASAMPAPVTPLPKSAIVDTPLMTPRTEDQAVLPPFPESQTLTQSVLRARLSKKVKGNNYLTPQEMEELSKD